MGISIDKIWWDNLGNLQPKEQAQVIKAVRQYQKSPDHPSLNLEKVKARGGKRRLWTFRASLELRVLLARQGNTTLFLRVGHHDDIYKIGEQRAFVVPASDAPGLMRIVREPVLNEKDTVPPSPVLAKKTPIVDVPSKSIVEHWTNKELAQAGFTESETEKLRQASQETLFEVWPELEDNEDKWDLICKCVEATPETVLQEEILADEEAENARFREAIVKRGALAGLSTLLSPEEFERLISAPIEEWMIFLHPDQRALVERSFNGPARVRGAAGTGKTVVALHRAATLAKRYSAENSGRRPPVLFTTFIKSLPPVLKNLYERLPKRVDDGVEFVHVDKLARRLCEDAGQKVRVDTDTAENAFGRAYLSVVRSRPRTPLHGQTPVYLREEITSVLKGRGVDSLEEYLSNGTNRPQGAFQQRNARAGLGIVRRVQQTACQRRSGGSPKHT